jgi:hypothetical protein
MVFVRAARSRMRDFFKTRQSRKESLRDFIESRGFTYIKPAGFDEIPQTFPAGIMFLTTAGSRKRAAL